MKTNSKEYHEYIANKYLPGRSLYLHLFFYPRVLRELKAEGAIVDLGCGMGEFLKFCKQKNRDVLGVDSNEALVKSCTNKGYRVFVDNICELNILKETQLSNALSDNVLEHLEISEISNFFARIENVLRPGGTLVCIVPGVKGFKNDPTHKTFVDKKLLLTLLENSRLKLVRNYFHLINMTGIDKFFYLNRQVFILVNK